ncbi:LysM peptidoglycan-binding domain-containing protein [Hallerella sp.]|uniref:lytic transglycosylase n=1 Tax=Hallerella sp. TaxID=2815812 RepID=UPI002590818B|nr:LysM peptidoglycan-binding domain-containing protein [Hallerella sp.]
MSPEEELRESWQQYQFALQAMEDEDWLVARHHLDLALKKLVEENYDPVYSIQARPQDSLYRRDMPHKLIAALDEVYPQILAMGEDASVYVRYEFDDAGLENLDEPPLDSAEREEIESFLDTLNRAEFTLPIEFNERVMQEIQYMSTRAHDFTEASLSRKTAFEEMIYAKIDSMGMPRDLIFLSLVESGYKIKAYSRAKAAGLWQFIPSTGKRYGLYQDFWMDMRRNPELSTVAAMRYLKRLHDEFGDWLMAMAAYNCGEGCVRRRIRELKEDTLWDSTKTITYWDLNLPKETMHYVPRILAAMTIGHYPEHYGMDVEKREPVAFDTVTVVEFMPLDQVAKAAGVDTKTIQELNLELNRWCTPPKESGYVMRIPEGTRDSFLVAYEKMDKKSWSRWQYHKVMSGENLGKISRKYGVSVKDIQSANHLKNTRIRCGQTLMIPLPSSAYNSNSSKNSTQTNSSQSSKKSSVRTYKVKPGDNLGSIARKFGVSVSQLQKWNGVDGSAIRAGQVLYVEKPVEKPVEKAIAKPVEKKSEGNFIKHTVQSGESLWDISRTYGVTIEQIVEWNKKKSTKVKAGEVLRIQPNR